MLKGVGLPTNGKRVAVALGAVLTLVASAGCPKDHPKPVSLRIEAMRLSADGGSFPEVPARTYWVRGGRDFTVSFERLAMTMKHEEDEFVCNFCDVDDCERPGGDDLDAALFVSAISSSLSAMGPAEPSPVPVFPVPTGACGSGADVTLGASSVTAFSAQFKSPVGDGTRADVPRVEVERAIDALPDSGSSPSLREFEPVYAVTLPAVPLPPQPMTRHDRFNWWFAVDAGRSSVSSHPFWRDSFPDDALVGRVRVLVGRFEEGPGITDAAGRPTDDDYGRFVEREDVTELLELVTVAPNDVNIRYSNIEGSYKRGDWDDRACCIRESDAPSDRIVDLGSRCFAPGRESPEDPDRGCDFPGAHAPVTATPSHVFQNRSGTVRFVDAEGFAASWLAVFREPPNVSQGEALAIEFTMRAGP